MPVGWVTVEVETPSGKDTALVWAADVAPGIFVFDAQRQPAALHPDGTPAWNPSEPGANGRPARPGDILAIYGTGFGPTLPEVPVGQIFSGAAPLANPDEAEVRIGGMPAKVQFIGLSGAGLNQINVVVPDLQAGTHPVELKMGGVPVSGLR
ncbi:MAG: hypothetical protein KIT83_01815 [Bryobacterales bacterium]|nr:hypothetical protein [Bryobacterales bacterium]